MEGETKGGGGLSTIGFCGRTMRGRLVLGEDTKEGIMATVELDHAIVTATATAQVLFCTSAFHCSALRATNVIKLSEMIN